MRWFIVYSSVILLVPISIAAPTTPQNSITKDGLNEEWYPVPEAYPRLNSVPFYPNNTTRITNSTSGRGSPDDPLHSYLVLLHNNETRPWGDVFDDIGFAVKKIELHGSGFHFEGEEDEDHGHNAFEIDEGTRITTFGTHIRMFTMEMLESEAESMGGLDSIAEVSKNQPIYGGLYGVSIMPKHSRQLYNATNSESTFEKRQQQQVLSGNQGEVQTQRGAPWGLQRISEANRVPPNVGSGPTGLDFTYMYDSSAGKGVDVYMLDSGKDGLLSLEVIKADLGWLTLKFIKIGINVEHVDFGGRAKMVFSAWGPNHMYDDDQVGHGTHTAGTVGSATYGVAKGVNLFGLKVLDSRNSGTSDGFAAAFVRALAMHEQRRKEPGFVGSVISASIGNMPHVPAMFNIIQEATNRGMHISFSAMNDNKDACSSYPGGYSTRLPIFNVGATDINDNRAKFSNFGKCITMHGPGVSILSTTNRNNQGSNNLDGTSMACPAVSGLIALELAKNPNLRFDPAGMKRHILQMSLGGKLSGTSGGDTIMNNGIKNR
ncbi:hypothetical protein TWF694_009249 [Orbilia ellipsospora]|uniref:Peptidase S8/S53 domain-containing protein n=1 Tax=Orbilia ellipsospora TaxID=2528407 RepID=A0AAV9XEC2_9PEZI